MLNDAPFLAGRSSNCDCTVEYVVGKKRQNVHSKKTIYEEGKIEVTEKRIMINDVIEDVTEKYFKNATPGFGEKVIDDDVEDFDRDMTELLYNIFGGDIHCLKDTPNKGKRPDALWNGIYWEYKAPTTKNAVQCRIKKARIQISERIQIDGRDKNERRGIVLDIGERTIEREQIINEIYKEIKLQSHHPTDVIILENSKVIQIIRVHT